ncbi:GNAT family N-acetyltransferase [Arthrobacter sp. RT-1]|uniref:GNAT family N-acetyltransferase n=1 Tax=Arthrobacter sp. RT-1 TaxID=2292263 RepID=UPI0015F17C30|nr:GNAT family N-acetyltransferase [Arthrobacter sp. RT-1]
MSEVIRPIEESEFPEFVRVLENAAGRHVTPQSVEDARISYPLDRALALCSDGVIVGGTASDALELTVCGPAVVPAARATLTGVLPTHRGRGLATALLTRQVQDLRQAGEVLVVATTSVPGLVTAADYAPVSRAAAVELHPRSLRLAAPERTGTVRMLEADELPTQLPGIFDRHRRRQPGQVHRRTDFWRTWFLDRPLYRIGDGPRFVALYQDDEGVPQGYLTYRLQPEDLREQPVGELVIEDLITVTNDARRDLWVYAATFTQARTVRAVNVPLDEPLRWLLSDPRGLRTTGVRDFLWLRILDIAAALSTRAYAVHDRLLLEVHDRHIRENAGRYELTVAPNSIACVRTDAPPDMVVDIAALAAAYLGDTTMTTLAAAGRVRECRPGALARADALFGLRPGPWTVTDW